MAIPIACGLAAVLILYWNALHVGHVARVFSFAALAMLAIIAVGVAFSQKDALNPLSVLMALCCLRLSIPAATVSAPESPTSPLLRDFAVSPDELVAGQHLATLGLLAMTLGWYACPPILARPVAATYRWTGRTLTPDPRIVPAAIVTLAAGFLGTIAFLALSFGDPLEAARSGVARGNTAPGTSRYAFAAVGLLVAGSVLIALYQAQAARVTLPRVFLPPLAASAVLTILGGRIVALTPLALAFIGYQYLHRATNLGWKRPRLIPKGRTLVISGAILILGLAYVASVLQYRGGGGATAFSAALDVSAITEYAEYALWSEVSALHPYALATRLEGGVMDGSTYPGILGVVGTLAGIEWQQPGTFLVDQLGPGGYPGTWGFQTGLVVDVFLNTGLVAAVGAAVIFGLTLRAEYDGFRDAGPTLGATLLHCLAVWTFVWIYFESILVIPSQMQSVLPIAGCVILASKLLPLRTPPSGV